MFLLSTQGEGSHTDAFCKHTSLFLAQESRSLNKQLNRYSSFCMYELTYTNIIHAAWCVNVNNFQSSVLRKPAPGGQEASSTVNVLTADG